MIVVSIKKFGFMHIFFTKAFVMKGPSFARIICTFASFARLHEFYLTGACSFSTANIQHGQPATGNMEIVALKDLFCTYQRN